ncbi:putative ribonuclease H-like domain-containing protein [Tanacetum coccineum]
MCDKKNSVLFNDTECIVLSPNFKLTDESHVLLKVPRKNNMYSVDLKNIVSKGGLTCLFAKATSDESKLWHRRLGHINFKTMNKLVKGNLVKGLPLKLFENNQTCVACQKGKQHRASCKSKTEISLMSSKSSQDDGSKPSSDDEKKVDEDPRKDSENYVKSALLMESIEEEVYVCQPLGFEYLDFSNRVYKVEKALYGLHQAPRAWYETLSTYLLDNGFQRGKIDKTLFIRRDKGDIMLVQVYVDDIIFGFTKKSLCNAFEKLMHEKFYMSSMGELTFFLGLQVKQKNDGIFISQDKYVAEILKRFVFIKVKTASTPIKTQKPFLKDEDGEEVDVHIYRLMIGSLMYLASSRPDIMFTVCACARYQVNSNVSHLHVVKRIFRHNLLLLLKVNAVRHKLTTAGES